MRLYADEGMIGRYTKRLHEAGDEVLVRTGDAWAPAIVHQARRDEYIALRGAQYIKHMSHGRYAGEWIKVPRSCIRDKPDTPSNSWFRIQKCARSVTLVHGGRRKSPLPFCHVTVSRPPENETPVSVTSATSSPHMVSPRR